ncbi:MAG: hypothetical protein PWQ34_974 [Caldanaerobacter sp.]|nr:hypothetical protein [Caldanaerobacter sp.]
MTYTMNLKGDIKNNQTKGTVPFVWSPLSVTMYGVESNYLKKVYAFIGNEEVVIIMSYKHN